MRKRVINHVADTIFWYILYFLPVLAYLFFVISAPLRDNFIAEEPVYEERTVCTIPADIPFEINPYSNFTASALVIANFSEDIDGYSRFMSYFSIATSVSSSNFTDGVLYFDTTNYSLLVPYTFSLPFGTRLNEFYVYTDNVYEPALSLDVSLLQYDTELILIGSSPQNLYDFKDFVNSMGFEFATDNIIVNSLADIFGTGGIMPMFDNDTPFIIFAWFIGVYLLHLLVDFLLFIPRIAHKWMKDCTGGD